MSERPYRLQGWRACIPRTAPRHSFLPAIFCLLLTSSQAAGPFATRERLHQPAGPLAEKALAALAERTSDLQHKLLKQHMASVLAEMEEPLKLTPEDIFGLTTAIDQAVGLAAASWKSCMTAGLRPTLAKFGDDAAQATRISTWTAEQIVPGLLVAKWTPPEWLPQWDEAVEARLGAARAVQWKALREEKRKALLPALAPLLQSWADAGRKGMEDALAENSRLFAEAAHLPLRETEQLAKLMRQLVDDHVTSEKEAGRDMLLNTRHATRKALLSGKPMNAGFLIPSAEELEAAWTGLARQVAGEAAVGAWQNAREQKKQELAKRRQEVLKPSRDRVRIELEDQMNQEAGGVMTALELAPERRKKIEDLGQKVVTEILERNAKRWLESVETWSEEDLLSHKNRLFGLAANDSLNQRLLWREGLKQLLTPEEWGQVKQSVEERKARGVLALARVALADADTVLSLTEEQRQALEPLVVPQMRQLIREETAKMWRVEDHQLQAAASKAPTEEVRAILDEAQTQLWQKLGLPTPQQRRVAAPAGEPAAQPPPGRSAAELATGLEAEISSHLHRRSLKQRAEHLQSMMTQVGDARRTLNLDPERTERLGLAAKGATEATMTGWRQKLESWTRAQIDEDATPETVKVLLGTLESRNISFFSNREETSQQAVWQQTIEAVLSEQERAAWKKVIAERKAYRVRAWAGMAVFELDRRRRLGPQQCARLTKILAAVVEDYLPEIESSMSMSRSWSWHLSYYSSLMPLAGAKTADLQAVLTPAQWKLVKERDLPDAQRYWSNIENRRKNGKALLIFAQ